jgi:DNA invertase Pin-like site-specific DNA recombinase
LGGTKTIPLCGGCHSLVHGGYFRRRDDHAALTRLGLQRARERGVKLGNPRLQETSRLGAETTKRLADEFAEGVKETLLDAIRETGTYKKAAKLLNEKKVPLPRGGKWTAQSICNLLARLKIQRSDI